METKINDVKEFAIGSKIEYDGKLYEVSKGKYCDNCSIANICSSSDIPNSNKFANALSRDQKIRIFGKCSNINRDDGTDIVFKEIHEDIPEIDNNIVKPLYAGSNKSQLRPVEFDMPKDFIIDIKNSDFIKGIIYFKNKWLTLEQLHNIMRENNISMYYDNCMNFAPNKLLALANLMDIASYFNKGWSYDVNQDSVGYLIIYDRSIKEPCYNIREIDSTIDVYYGNPVFKNKADAKYVIDNPNFRDILDKIFKG